MKTELGNDLLIPSCAPGSLRKTNSCVASKRAAASASAVDVATVDCSFECQPIAAEVKKTVATS